MSSVILEFPLERAQVALSVVHGDLAYDPREESMEEEE